MNAKDKVSDRQYYIVITLLLAVAVFLRFFKLTQLPYGIHVDEAGMGYDAWCLANFGTDRYAFHNPVYLINFGGGQSALYAYLCAFLIKITGGNLSLLLIRLPGAIMGIAVVIFGTMIIKRCMGKRAAIVGMTLLTICPYFIMHARFGLDCNLMLPVGTIALFFMIMALEQKKKFFWAISGLFFGIFLYTYALSYIVLPLFLLFVFLYLLYCRQISRKDVLVFAIPLAVLAVPLLVFVGINNGAGESIITPFFSIPALPGYRSGEFVFSLSKIMGNIDRLFDCIFFRDGLDYTAFSKYYTLYSITIPFAILGICLGFYHLFCSLEKRTFRSECLITFFFLAEFILGCILGSAGPSTYKLNGIFFSIIYFTTIGLLFSYRNCGKLKKGFAVIMGLIYLGNFLLFARCYFVQYKTNVYPQEHFETSYQEAVRFLEEKEIDGKYYIYLEQQPYIYYFIDNLPSPEENGMQQVLSEMKGPYPVVRAYERMVFQMPDTISAEDSYIVKMTDAYHMEQIETSGYQFGKETIGDYVVYYSLKE